MRNDRNVMVYCKPDECMITFGFSSVSDTATLGKNRIRTYNLPICSPDALPLSYTWETRGNVGIKPMSLT